MDQKTTKKSMAAGERDFWPALEAEEPDETHSLQVEQAEDEIHVSANHPMDKGHYISFLAYMTPDDCEIKALYPEGGAEARFFYRGSGWLYGYCNRHGLFRQKIQAISNDQRTAVWKH